MKANSPQKVAGFTMVELLVVIAIIGMLAALISAAVVGALGTANQTVIVAADTEATSSSDQDFQILLPQINAGGGATVAVAYELRLTTTGFGGFEVLDFNLARVGFVPGHSQAVVTAEAGEAEGVGTPQQWNFTLRAAKPAATIADADVAVALAAEATDSPLRADVDTKLNALGVTVNAIIAVLDGAGLTKTE